MKNAKHVHCIGIGGIGVSAAAKWWRAQGAAVTGSDMHPSEIIDELESQGIDVNIGHFADNIPRECDLVIYSVAVPANNVERRAAQKRGFEIWSYPEFLGKLAEGKKTIAVSGTNGKSTTTAMTAKILIDAGLDPTVLLGSKMKDLPEGNLRVGESDWLVLEACEHMASMLKVFPDAAVVTNIEEDHLDFYKDLGHIRETFQKWVGQVQGDGPVVLNARDEESKKLEVDNVYWFDAFERTIAGNKQSFLLKAEDTPADGLDIQLNVPGEFNTMNAAASATVASVVGVGNDVIRTALSGYAGIWRRMERVGLWHEADVYSDYAHHPSGVEGALEAFREAFAERRLVVVFEPHQYSRTKELFDEFISAFDPADVLIISEIYEVAGRSEEHESEHAVSSKDLADEVKHRGKISGVYYAQDRDRAEDRLRDLVEPEDVVVVMGAGTIDRLARKLAG